MVQERTNLVSWDDLAAILAVGRSRSVRAAAEQIGVSHTTLARRIESAEEALGCVVFIRSANGYVLTDVGERLLQRVARMEEEADAATRDAAGGDRLPRGQVRISMPPALLDCCLAAALPEFHERYPQLQLDFDTQYGFSNLDRHETDIAVRYQAKPSDHLVGIKAGVSRELAYATKNVAEALQQGKQPTLIGWSRSSAFDRRVKALGLEACEIGFVCPDLHGQVSLAEAGLGIAILPTLVGDTSKVLMRINAPAAYEASAVWVLTHPDLRNSIRVKTVSAFLVAELKKALTEA